MSDLQNITDEELKRKETAMNNIQLTNVSSELTMSSREIAELCEKQHQHVKRDIEKMLEGLNLGASKFGRTYLNSQNKSIKEYHLPKDLTVTLITGYRVDIRYKVVKRLEELEQGQPAFEIPDNLPDALRLAAELGERAKKAEVALLEAQPKTDFFDKFCNADGIYGLQNAGRALECRPNLFVRWLKSKYLFYQGGNLIPRAQYIQNGMFEVKMTIIGDKVRPQAYITPKGLKKLAECLPDEIRLREVA